MLGQSRKVGAAHASQRSKYAESKTDSARHFYFQNILKNS
jgi:hypothetical protein